MERHLKHALRWGRKQLRSVYPFRITPPHLVPSGDTHCTSAPANAGSEPCWHAESAHKHPRMRLQVTIEDYMSEFEAPGAAPAADVQLAAQLSGPWMKALLADEDEAAGTDLFSQLTPTPATPQPASGIDDPHRMSLHVNALDPRSAV